MGKGKAKGFRPPRADDPNTGMLFGSAAHLTGDTVASPVQLREEGRSIPQGHPNFGEEYTKGGGKGKGNGPTGANCVPVAPKTKAQDPQKMPSPPSLLPASAKGSPPVATPLKPEVVREPSTPSTMVQPTSKAPSQVGSPPSLPSQTPAKTASFTPTLPTCKDGLSEIERRRAALTEIERRRAAMLERERVREPAEPQGEEGTCKSEFAAHDVGIACKEEDGLPKNDAVEEEDEDEEDEVARAAARRRRLQVEEDGGEENNHKGDVKRHCGESDEGKTSVGMQGQSSTAAQSGAMKQGLQEWAARVNALASEGDADMAQRCRGFVRQRILRAQAEGNLHTLDWSEEPVPSVDELMSEST